MNQAERQSKTDEKKQINQKIKNKNIFIFFNISSKFEVGETMQMGTLIQVHIHKIQGSYAQIQVHMHKYRLIYTNTGSNTHIDAKIDIL